MAKRDIPEINAGSMADIAFLLLIFFLVTTTIQTDSGLSVLLPPYVEEPPPPEKKNKRNVFAVQINANNQLLVRGRPLPLSDIKEIKVRLKEFIMNNGKDPNASDSPKLAVVSLLNDNGTSYEAYVGVYDQLKAAYNELWEESAQRKYGRSYEDLDRKERKSIRDEIPLVISEAEPTSIST
ncbi:MULTISPECIES: biopolymer transporter ExbD [unclassified Aureispira]|uniref:ExbD/TolR family protein n=1 Tax=unclassified Aureispira TaxID=2649989 RepID=UPI00069674F1|nr:MULTISPECIES: biopolymer transporter ExbD [unclassified Aureispira]WMX14350.1 biopolymer transporter ExbD [Aureispira sp. CCB-E]